MKHPKIKAKLNCRALCGALLLISSSAFAQMAKPTKAEMFDNDFFSDVDQKQLEAAIEKIRGQENQKILSPQDQQKCDAAYAKLFSKPDIRWSVFFGYGDQYDHGQHTSDMVERTLFEDNIVRPCKDLAQGIALCGFIPEASRPGEYVRELVTKHQGIVRVHLLLYHSSLTSSTEQNEKLRKAEQLKLSKSVEQAYLQALNTDDIVFYSGTVAVANGGTGIASYTIGDLIYASAATTLSKLPDVAAGSALVSGGVGVAPSYSTTIGGINHSANSLSNNAGALTISGATNLTLASNSGNVTTVGNTLAASSTTINGGGTGGGISLVPGTLGINVSGWTNAGYVKNDTSGNLTGGNLMASGDITTGLGYTPVNKAGDTMTGALVVGGAIVSSSTSVSVASLNFNTGNVQMTSSAATTINLCGLKDGGAYTLVLTGIAAANTVTIAAQPSWSAGACSGTAIQVDLGAGATTFVTAGSTNILSFIYFSGRGSNGTLYGVPSTNYTY